MKGKLREDIFSNLSIFTKYKIRGDDRPDNGIDFYGDEFGLVSFTVIFWNVYNEW